MSNAGSSRSLNLNTCQNGEDGDMAVPLESQVDLVDCAPQQPQITTKELKTSEISQQRRSSRLVAKRLHYSPSPLDFVKVKESNEQYSDYGTGSERSFYVTSNSNQDVEDRFPSPSNSFESEDDLLSDIYHDHTLSPGYVKQVELNRHLSDLSLQEDDDNDDFCAEKSTSTYLDISSLSSRFIKIKTINLLGIRMLVPLEGCEFPKNKTVTSPRKHAFSISVIGINTPGGIDVENVLLNSGLRITQSCPVFKFEPIGTRFCELYPAIVVIDLTVIPSEHDEVICLHSLDPQKGWSMLSEAYLSEDRTRLSLKTFMLSYVTVVIRPKCQQHCKFIRCRVGGRLMVSDVNVGVEFPKGSISEDIEVSAKVCFDREFCSRQFFSTLNDKDIEDYTATVASPTVSLEPHGVYFEEPVRISLPIPDYYWMMNTYGKAGLRILHSNTKSEAEKADWQYLDTPIQLTKTKCKNGNVMMIATFSVHHFSFFRAVWDKISNTLYQARISVFHLLINYAMKVQAFCEEFDDDRFGLEVICFRNEQKFPKNTYKFLCGQSQSKLVKPGRLTVRLKSLCFIADASAGEDENLVKEEDFCGWDFEKQFACKFKAGTKVERGPFGKVAVSRQKNGELLFEFNIQKYGHENENTPCVQDRWGELAISELAANFFITDGDNWKKLATHIGFTKTEIKSNFKNTSDPLTAIITKYKQRGGTADEFVNAIYSVHRDLKISMASPSSSKQSRSSNNSSGRGSMGTKFNKRGGPGHESDTSGTQTSLYSQDSLLSSARKRSNPSVNDANPKTKKRRMHAADNIVSVSDADGESSSASDSEKTRSKMGSKEGDANSIQFRKDLTKLNNSFLWEVSADMDTVTWRALGRSLGVEESTLINIEHAHKSSGFREMSYQVLLHWKEKYPRRCTFGTLYSALSKENMNSAAKKMINIQKNDSDS